jgi:hypothetical protein
LDATEVIAAHCVPWWLSLSITSRTARSRTSAEYLLRLPFAPSSQQMEPPVKPGRFNRHDLTKRDHKKRQLSYLAPYGGPGVFGLSAAGNF